MHRRAQGDAGASLVEFALVLPLFVMLLLGMLTGGLAYSRKLAVTQAAREGARYGATLPLPANVDDWLQAVADVTVASSDGELEAGETGMRLCVAFVPSSAADTPRRIDVVGAAVSFTNGACYADGRSGEARVQVVGSRTSRLETLVWSRDLSLVARAVARFEAG